MDEYLLIKSDLMNERPPLVKFINFLTASSCLWLPMDESQKEVSRKQNTPNFPKKEHFLPPDMHKVLEYFFLN